MDLNFVHFELDNCKFLNFKAKQHSGLKEKSRKKLRGSGNDLKRYV